MKTVKTPRQRQKHRFKQGCHPDSLANLNGSTPLYEARKINFSIGLTPHTKGKLKTIADDNDLSLSEVIERIARGLSADAIQKLVQPKA